MQPIIRSQVKGRYDLPESLGLEVHHLLLHPISVARIGERPDPVVVGWSVAGQDSTIEPPTVVQREEIVGETDAPLPRRGD